MRKILLIAVVSAFALAAVAAGCGGGDGKAVPDNAVAVVGDVDVTRAEYDAILEQAKRSYDQQKRDFPKAGTPEHNQLKNQAIQFLVQRAQFAQKAEELDVEVTEKQVDARLAQIKKQYFSGDQKKYEKQLKAQGLTDEQVRKDIRAQLISEGIFKKVTDDVKVTDAEIEKFYNENKDKYSQKEQRDVRHILVKEKAKADQLYDELQGGADFAKLAKANSIDPGSKANGGKLTITKGQTVAPFDQTAFLLETDKISRPVKTEYGYHIIQPLSAIKPAQTTPLKDVKEAIRQQLIQQKRNERMTKWVEDLKKEFEGDIDYAVGFNPPPDAATTTGSDDEDE
jgi:parvulin-like peptidyl-prolyl isomerase